jgi:esterase/lipase superfamily enzyme
VPAAAEALTRFLQTEGADNFDILAHSLGCKVVCAALAKTDSDSSPAPLADPLPNVILEAPDVDKEDFGTVFLTPGDAAARHTTVYVARNDKALVLIENQDRVGRKENQMHSSRKHVCAAASKDQNG